MISKNQSNYIRDSTLEYKELAKITGVSIRSICRIRKNRKKIYNDAELFIKVKRIDINLEDYRVRIAIIDQYGDEKIYIKYVSIVDKFIELYLQKHPKHQVYKIMESRMDFVSLYPKKFVSLLKQHNNFNQITSFKDY